MPEDPLNLDAFLPYVLTQVAQRVSTQLARTYQERFDLTIPEWRVLAYLGEQEQATAKQIGTSSFMDKVKTSRAIKALTEKGLLDKQPNLADQRAVWLRLNPAGRDLYDQVVPVARRWEQELLDTLSPSERTQLHSLLEKLKGQLTR